VTKNVYEENVILQPQESFSPLIRAVSHPLDASLIFAWTEIPQWKGSLPRGSGKIAFRPHQNHAVQS
jgi:hypothetical protein